MSGGHFGYGCFRVSQFADDVQLEIRCNEDDTLDAYGCVRGRHFTEETMQALTRAHAHMEMAGRLAKEIEWLYSDDIGEDTFLAAVREIEGLKS